VEEGMYEVHWLNLWRSTTNVKRVSESWKYNFISAIYYAHDTINTTNNKNQQKIYQPPPTSPIETVSPQRKDGWLQKFSKQKSNNTFYPQQPRDDVGDDFWRFNWSAKQVSHTSLFVFFVVVFFFHLRPLTKKRREKKRILQRYTQICSPTPYSIKVYTSQDREKWKIIKSFY